MDFVECTQDRHDYCVRFSARDATGGYMV
jgi:hypothetical protein